MPKRYHNSKMKNRGKKAGDMMEMYSSAHAAMPQDVRMHDYAKYDYIEGGPYPDTYSELNREYNHMVKEAKKQSKRGRY